jgi:hypothetical protein
MRNDKEQALKLRLSGHSYTEIQRLLGIPKSTLSGWFTNLELSTATRERMQARTNKSAIQALIKRNKQQTHFAIQRMREIRLESNREIQKISCSDLKLIGTALYWAEGYKRPQIRNGKERTYHPVALTNSDPKLIMLFLRFLREVCKVPDTSITADIRIYKHLNEDELFTFWQKITQIPIENFGKVYYDVSKSSLGKRPFNRLPYGTIMIRVNQTKLFHRIMGWIEGLAQQTL